MNDYELTFIVRPDADEERQAEIKDRVRQYIVDNGGQIAAVREWGQRRLAYPIRRQTSGVYITFRFRLPPGEADGLQRMLRLNEDVLRFLLLTAEQAPTPES